MVMFGQIMMMMGMMICCGNGTDDAVDGGCTAGDLDVILLSSTGEIPVAERATKVGDMITVEGSVAAARPRGCEEADGKLGNGKAVGFGLRSQ